MRMPLRVLMAEDEDLAAEVLQEVLEDAGFEVLLAPDGQAALELAAAGAGFDVLLTDLRMPRLDGRELILRLRAERPSLPVVVMTGFAPPEGPERLHDGSGPLRLLTKPIDLSGLVSALRAVAHEG
ncbi:response regulator [Siccirubricoccus sp. KC 17139]|uniref:Response regulator n=1 Tax=Siccirubricoccus soli TaxID=2899147 RepID=A0ABT1D9K4_9PROT|nr:response regulator [Siccirubricoccus soli]MCO6418616.1 response regulator [Siccirubricoccus soli]MCP2684751.1 response regulator [Siccirubricoccus soli]